MDNESLPPHKGKTSEENLGGVIRLHHESSNFLTIVTTIKINLLGDALLSLRP